MQLPTYYKRDARRNLRIGFHLVASYASANILQKDARWNLRIGSRMGTSYAGADILEKTHTIGISIECHLMGGSHNSGLP